MPARAKCEVDQELRALLAEIARDETRHAALSWEIAAWIAPQLSLAERAELARVQREALAKLASELDLGLDGDAYRELGMPRPEVAAELLARLESALFA